MNNENGNITIEVEDGKPILVEVSAAINNLGQHLEGLRARVDSLEEVVRLQQESLKILGDILLRLKAEPAAQSNGARRLTN